MTQDLAGPGASRHAEAAREGETRAEPPRLLGERLVGEGLISADQRDIALLEQRRSGKMLGEVLVELGFITEHTLAATLAESSGLARFDLAHSVLDADTVKSLPRELAERYKVLPVAVTDEEVHLAMADVYNVVAIDQARRHFPRQLDVVPMVAAETELMDAIDSYYGYEMSIDGLLREIEGGEAPQVTTAEGIVNPTVRLVNAIILDAVKSGASDLHFEPEGLFVRLRYRLDGVMTQVRAFHKAYWPSVCVRLKIMSGMNIAETRNPQDGRFTFHVAAREVDFRVSAHPTIHGENIVVRVLDKTRSLKPLESLGYAAATVDRIKTLLRRPEGIVIVTGPTGSGKTTTLYSALDYLNGMDRNIMTLEEPVEYRLPLIRQSDVRDAGGMDFAEGVRSILRQDPDVVFVGEVRDEATATMALRAAMTGHQVFTTLHTNDAVGAVYRLIDLGLAPGMLAGNVIGVLAQRLLRTLCDACAEGYEADDRECRVLGVDPDERPRLYRAVGCEACRNTGYRGRTAIIEVMGFTREMDELIAADASRGALLAAAAGAGFVPMVEDGVAKVRAGVTSLDELIKTVNLIDRL